MVITIILIIILAAAVILSLNNNNPITNAKKSTFQNDVKSYTSELELYKSKQLVDSVGSFNPDTLSKGPYTTGSTAGTVKEILPNIKSEHQKKFKIQNGKLIYVGSITQEIDWLRELGLDVELIIDESTGKITGVKDFAYIYGTLEIPEYVTGIAPNAFYKNLGIESIDFSKNNKITEIPSLAFSGCTNLTTIIFSNNIVRIGDSAFSSCSKLNNVILPDSVNWIGSSAFYLCSSLTNIKFPVNSEFKVMNQLVLGTTKIVNFTLPESVTTIKINSFYNCYSLETINIGKNVSIIENSAFSGSSKLANINVVSGNSSFVSDDGILYSKNFEELILCPSNKTTVSINSNTKKLLAGSFSLAGKLLNINIPGNVSAIYNIGLKKDINIIVDSSSMYFKAIDNIVYTKDLTEIILAQNTSAQIVIPEQVTSISAYSFANCTKLEKVDMSKCSVEVLKTYAFQGCSNISEFIFPTTLKTIQYQAITGTKLQNIVIPEGVTTLDIIAFYVNNELTSVTLPSTLTNMSKSFGISKKLESVIIHPDNPKYMADDGVIYSKDKTELVCMADAGKSSFKVPNSVKTIKEYAFAYPSDLQSIELPQGLLTIEQSAFSAQNISTIVIPSSVTNIGPGAFKECGNLKEIRINKPQNSISGAPWAAPFGINTVKWN